MRFCQPRIPAKFAKFDGENAEEIIKLVQNNTKYSVLVSKEKISLYNEDRHITTCAKGNYLVYSDSRGGFIVFSANEFDENYKEIQLMKILGGRCYASIRDMQEESNKVPTSQLHLRTDWNDKLEMNGDGGWD
jgi:hypothetical protein